MPVKTTTVSRVLLAALATAGASAAPAHSSVQIYGRLNTSLEHQKVGANSLTGLLNHNSRFGFVGSEELGGGLRAGFQLESGFESDTGAGTGSTGAGRGDGGTAKAGGADPRGTAEAKAAACWTVGSDTSERRGRWTVWRDGVTA